MSTSNKERSSSPKKTSTSNTEVGSPSPKKPKFANVETVTLYVGKDKLKFQVHEDKLFDASPLFRKAFNTDSEEGPERVLDFSDEDPGLFGYLIESIYSKSFSLDMFADAKSNSESQIQAAQLFVLAEKYGVKKVMLNIGINLHAYGKAHNNVPPERRAVEIAYKHTYPDSILRQVFVDWHSECIDEGDKGLRDWLSTVPEFASSLAVTTSRYMHYLFKSQEEYLLKLQSKKI